MVWIDAGGDDIAADFFAGLEDNAGGAAVPVEDFSDGALVRISTPSSRAAAAIALEIAPVPPRLKPHERKAPSISPI